MAGTATWYRYRAAQAAAAAALRAFLGPTWRGSRVLVCGRASCVVVALTDYEASSVPGRLIDLDARSFLAACGPLSMGVCRVTVRRA